MQILATHGVLGFSTETLLVTGCLSTEADTWLAAIRHGGDPLPAALPADRAEALHALAQQLVLLGRTDDAAVCFERCLEALPLQSRPDHQARLALMNGLRSLHRHDLPNAWKHLHESLDITLAPLTVIITAHAALAALHFSLGQRQCALDAVERSLMLLDPEADLNRTPRAVLQALRAEFVVLDLLRRHERLQDLAGQPLQAGTSDTGSKLAQAREELDRCRADAAELGFVRERLDYLECLVAIAYDGADAESQALLHIQLLGDRGLVEHALAAQHELTLACIAAQRSESLMQLMYHDPGADATAPRLQHHRERSYCLAKLAEMMGDHDTHRRCYEEYVALAVSDLRSAAAHLAVPCALQHAVTESADDAVALRLVGKYRRAYRFIMAHRDNEELQARDVAESIDVSEQALQFAFRAMLGRSTSEVMWECRLNPDRPIPAQPASRPNPLVSVAGALQTLRRGTVVGLRSPTPPARGPQASPEQAFCPVSAHGHLSVSAHLASQPRRAPARARRTGGSRLRTIASRSSSGDSAEHEWRRASERRRGVGAAL